MRPLPEGQPPQQTKATPAAHHEKRAGRLTAVSCTKGEVTTSAASKEEVLSDMHAFFRTAIRFPFTTAPAREALHAAPGGGLPAMPNLYE